MEQPESSSPYLQAPAICPYPEPTPSSPHNPFPLPEDLSEYYPPIYVLVSCHMPRPSQSSPFYHPHNIWWAVQIIKLLIM